jgi:hypothetical protein
MFGTRLSISATSVVHRVNIMLSYQQVASRGEKEIGEVRLALRLLMVRSGATSPAYEEAATIQLMM